MKVKETELNPVWVAKNRIRKTVKIPRLEIIIQNGKLFVNASQVLFLLSMKYINYFLLILKLLTLREIKIKYFFRDILF